MTRTEKNIIKELKNHIPEKDYGSLSHRWTIGSIRTTTAMLEKMREKGLIIIGSHPAGPWTYTVKANKKGRAG